MVACLHVAGMQVGAGTMNPLGTFLRVLGPEPWNAVYLEPSVRPDDSRYGDNPNRLACHHQIQASILSTSRMGVLTSASTMAEHPRTLALVSSEWQGPCRSR